MNDADRQDQHVQDQLDDLDQDNLDQDKKGAGDGGDAKGDDQKGKETAAETKAREMGWKPHSEWAGDDSGWMEAEDFVENRERQISRADKIAQDQITRLETQIGKMQKTMASFAAHHTKTEQRAYERALKDIEAKQREAVADGDTETFDELSKDAEELRKDAAEAAKDTPATADKDTNPDNNPNFIAFAADNTWYNSDVQMTIFANQCAPIIGPKHPPDSKAFYDAIEAEVRKQFPDNFTNTRRRAPATVESGNGAGRNTGTKTYANLPPEAKAACDDFVDQELMTRDQYVAEYEWED